MGRKTPEEDKNPKMFHQMANDWRREWGWQAMSLTPW